MTISNPEASEIKKKLESYSKAAKGPTLEAIQDKIKKADEKRRELLPK